MFVLPNTGELLSKPLEFAIAAPGASELAGPRRVSVG
jgi:hypothetical protein